MERNAADEGGRAPAVLLIIVIRRRPPLGGRIPTAWLQPESEPVKRKEGPCPPMR